MNNAYQLVVRKGPQPGQTFSLFSTTTTIGRDPISDIAINDPEVSRQHARFTQTSDSYQIEDLQSTNGTFVNGVQIGSEPVQLAHGNEIQLGSGVTVIFELMPDDNVEEMGLETAVPTTSPEDFISDPMLPPEFDQLSIIDNSAIINPPASVTEVSVTEVHEELDAAFAQEEAVPPPPPEMPRVTIPPAGTPPPDNSNENPARRLIAIGTALVLLMMCCCCGFIFFMYEWGGDWLLQQMGLVP